MDAERSKSNGGRGESVNATSSPSGLPRAACLDAPWRLAGIFDILMEEEENLFQCSEPAEGSPSGTRTAVKRGVESSSTVSPAVAISRTWPPLVRSEVRKWKW